MKKQPFYFTYGTNPEMDYQGGYIIIYAEDYDKARERYVEEFGTKDGIAMFSFQYTHEYWECIKVDMGKCHRIIDEEIDEGVEVVDGEKAVRIFVEEMVSGRCKGIQEVGNSKTQSCDFQFEDEKGEAYRTLRIYGSDAFAFDLTMKVVFENDYFKSQLAILKILEKMKLSERKENED